MDNLKEKEWNLMNDILLELYSIQDSCQLKENFLSFIRLLIPYTQAEFTTVDRLTGKVDKEHSVFVDTEEDYIDIYNQEFVGMDYLTATYKYSKTRTYWGTELIGEGVRENTKFYNEFLLPRNIPFEAGIILVKKGVLVGVISLYRSLEVGDFHSKDLYILDRLKHHIANMCYSLKTNETNESTLSSQKRTDYGAFDLSKRESEIISLISKGFSNDEIATKLTISISTVKRHIYNIFKKLDVSSRTQLIMFVNTSEKNQNQ